MQIQPQGCAVPTVHGTGFDASIVANMAVRVSVATMLRGSDGYPDIDWDIALLRLRDDHGNSTSPVWITYQHVVHEKCDLCRKPSNVWIPEATMGSVEGKLRVF